MHEMIEKTAFGLIDEIAQRDREIQNKRQELSRIQRGCHHQWAPIEYAPIIRDAYQTKEWSAGVDFEPSVYVPREETKRWKRSCMKCGFQQETQRTRIEEISGRIAGTSAAINVPDFDSLSYK